MDPRDVVSRAKITSVESAHAVRPCQPPEASLGCPARRPAAYPPASAARMPERVHQIAAPSENVVADALVLLAGSKVAAPMPTPRRLRISWVARAITTPPNTVPQEMRLMRMVRIL